MTRGHFLRDLAEKKAPLPARAREHRTRVLIAGGGVAGLAAARALRLRGVDDYALIELEDQAGGNARAGEVQGIPCPLGAHYLPLPSDAAPEVQDLLEELGLRRREAGRWVYDERHLCHSPQERLYFRGAWQEGILPLHDVGESTLAQYRRFAALVRAAQRAAPYTLPVRRGRAPAAHLALDALTFDAWLQQQGLSDVHLRWYLDYCCRDDYGAGLAHVSAWAGLHYFASRHGFHAPGEAEAEREGVLTWPEGNGWLTQRLAAPLGERLRTARAVLRIAEEKRGVVVDVWHTPTQTLERWYAERCIVALPAFVAARVVEGAPAFLREAAAQTHYAPWLVGNLHLKEPLLDRPGAAPSWDNVVYTENFGDQPSTSLGYVDAMHQSLQPVPGATVLSCYHALGDLPQGRQQLATQPWTYWRDHILAELLGPHPEVLRRATRLEITRYGHAMAIPRPGTLARLQKLPLSWAGTSKRAVLRAGRLSYAHGDWSGYSVFEEAFTQGHMAERK